MRKKPFKLLGPWLRKKRVAAGLSRREMAKAIARHPNFVSQVENCFRGVTCLRMLKSWLRACKAIDELDTGKRLYMADGAYMEVHIDKLCVEDRLRLVAIANLISEKRCPEDLREHIDHILSQGPVRVTKFRPKGTETKEGLEQAVTEFIYDPSSERVSTIKEMSHDQWQAERKAGGAGCSEDPQYDPGDQSET